MWKQIAKWENFVLMDLFLVLLGPNSTDLLWLKGVWFLLFLQLRGKWCLLILGGFPKTALIIKLFISKKYVDILYVNWYFINAWCAYWLFVLWKTCGTTWIYLNLYVWINHYIFENYEWIIFVSILKCVLKTYGKSWLDAQYGI